MSEYRQSVCDFILASRKVLGLDNLSNEETEVVRESVEKLLIVLDKDQN